MIGLCLLCLAPSGVPLDNVGYPIYEDSLKKGWETSASPGSVQTDESSSPFEGGHSMRWAPTTMRGHLDLRLKNGTVSLRGYESITFVLRSARATSTISVQLLGFNGLPIGNSVQLEGISPAGSWKRFDLPLSRLGVRNAEVSGVEWECSGLGKTLDLDRVGFVDAPFQDNFDRFDTDRWHKNGPWTVGGIFNCGWLHDHVLNDSHSLILQLDDQPSSGKPHTGGEVGSVAHYGYGRIEARMKPVHQSGVITSLFTYTGPSGGTPWDEIDVEFLGDDTTIVSLGYYTDGKGHACGHAKLGFDAAKDFHNYAIEWTPHRLSWLVDGKPVQTETGERGPLPSVPGEIMVNLWPTINADGWAGAFHYPGKPLRAVYQWIRFTPL